MVGKTTFLKPVVTLFLVFIIVFSVSSLAGAEDNITQEPDSDEIPDGVNETIEQSNVESNETSTENTEETEQIPEDVNSEETGQEEPDSDEINETTQEEQNPEETSPAEPDESIEQNQNETGLEEVTSYIELPDLMPSSSFSGTDFSQEEDLKNVKNLILENEHGIIDFGDETVNVEDLDIDAYVVISDNLVSVDSENIPNLDKPATITLFGLDYDHAPIIAQDGKICDGCRLISYDNNQVTFTVPHFTEYTIWDCVNVVDDLMIPDYTEVTICQDTFNVVDVGNNGTIILNGSNIILNCNGSTIIGTGTGIGVYGNGSMTLEQLKNMVNSLPPLAAIEDYANNNITYIENITISNCIITGFEYGIELESVQNASINNIEVYGNTEGISFLGRKSSISNVNAHDNDVGITAAGLDINVENIQAINNADTGIIAGGVRVNVSNSNSTLSGTGIITAGYNNQVFNNNASGNGLDNAMKHGIAVLWSNGTEVYNNIANNNLQRGIGLAESTDVKVYDNIANYNKDGISVSGFFSEGTFSLYNISNNTAMYNTRGGIVLSDGTFSRMLEMAMAKKSNKGQTIIESYIEYNNLYNTGDAYDFGIIDGTGTHVYNNTIVRNKFKGGGVYDIYAGNNYYCVQNGASDRGNSYPNGGIKGPGDCYNIAPNLTGLSNKTYLQNSGFHDNVIDLWNHTSDTQDKNESMIYTIISQDTGVINCTIDLNRYIDCNNSDWATGISNITVQAMDEGELPGNDTFEVEVVMNMPPSWDSPWIKFYDSDGFLIWPLYQTVLEGENINGSLFASDADIIPYGDYITYSIINDGGLVELKVNSTTGKLYSDNPIDYVKSNRTYNRTYNVSFLLTDSTGEETPKINYEITVQNVNRAPNITNVVIYTAEEGKYLLANIEGWDPDGPVDYFLVSSTLPEAKLNTTTGTIYSDVFLPPAAEVLYNIVVGMTDGSLNDTFSKDFEVQRPPTTPTSDSQNYIVSDNQLLPLEFDVYGSVDPNGDPFVYKIISLPTGAVFDNVTGHFSWDPTCSQDGVISIDVYAEDDKGAKSGEHTIVITVTNDC